MEAAQEQQGCLQSFNKVIVEFVQQLSLAFPLETALELAAYGLPNLLKKDPELALRTFDENFKDYESLITTKNETLFEKVTCLYEGINIKKLWQKSDAETREIIWEYINTLWILNSTIKTIPPELMKQVEQMAQNIVQQLQGGGGEDLIKNLMNNPDPQSMLNMLKTKVDLSTGSFLQNS